MNATADSDSSLTFEDATPIAAMLQDDEGTPNCTPIPYHRLSLVVYQRAQQLGFKLYKNLPSEMLAKYMYDEETNKSVHFTCIGFTTKDVFVMEDGVADVGGNLTMVSVYLDEEGMLWGHFEDDNAVKFGDEADMIRLLPKFMRG